MHVIEAYAFRFHCMDVREIEVDIVARERRHKTYLPMFVQRFLKWDLQRIVFSGKGQIGYGMGYEIQQDSFKFFGTVHKNIKDKTIVLQVVNARGRILREMWLHGEDVRHEGEPLKENPEDSTLVIAGTYA